MATPGGRTDDDDSSQESCNSWKSTQDKERTWVKNTGILNWVRLEALLWNLISNKMEWFLESYWRGLIVDRQLASQKEMEWTTWTVPYSPLLSPSIAPINQSLPHFSSNFNPFSPWSKTICLMLSYEDETPIRIKTGNKGTILAQLKLRKSGWVKSGGSWRCGWEIDFLRTTFHSSGVEVEMRDNKESEESCTSGESNEMMEITGGGAWGELKTLFLISDQTETDGGIRNVLLEWA